MTKTGTPTVRQIRKVIGKGTTMWERGAWTMDIASAKAWHTGRKNLVAEFGEPTSVSPRSGMTVWTAKTFEIRLYASCFRGAYVRFAILAGK